MWLKVLFFFYIVRVFLMSCCVPDDGTMNPESDPEYDPQSRTHIVNGLRYRLSQFVSVKPLQLNL